MQCRRTTSNDESSSGKKRKDFVANPISATPRRYKRAYARNDEDIVNYWSGDWSTTNKSNLEAIWFKLEKQRVSKVSDMEATNIVASDISGVLKRVQKWEAPEPDMVTTCVYPVLAKEHQLNLQMACIDYKKTFPSIPHDYILKITAYKLVRRLELNGKIQFILIHLGKDKKVN